MAMFSCKYSFVNRFFYSLIFCCISDQSLIHSFPFKFAKIFLPPSYSEQSYSPNMFGNAYCVFLVVCQ